MDMRTSFSEKVLNEAIRHVRTFIDNLINNTSDHRTIYSMTQQVEHQYHGRYLIELLQNGHDPLTLDHGRVEIAYVEDEKNWGALYAANDGVEIQEKDFHGLSRLGQSSKDPNELIGNKGIGFRSVLEVSECPEIFSRANQASSSFDGYCFKFDPDVINDVFSCLRSLAPGISGEQALFRGMRPVVDWGPERRKEFASRYMEMGENRIRDELKYLSPYSLTLPLHDSDKTERVRQYEKKEFSTVIRLPLKRQSTVEHVKKAIEDVSCDWLLFLPKITSLRLESPAVEKCFTRKSRELLRNERFVCEHVCLSDGKVSRDYWIWSATPTNWPGMQERVREAVKDLPGKWRDLRKVTISMAVRLGDVADDGCYSIFLPTLLRTGCGAHFNAPFFGDMSRTDINFNEPLNQLLLESFTKLAADVILNQLMPADDDVAQLPGNQELDKARAIVDLMAGTLRAASDNFIDRLSSHLSEQGQELRDLPVLLTDKGWKKAGAAKLLPKEAGTKWITFSAIRDKASFPLIASALSSRAHAVQQIMSCAENLFSSSTPTPEEMASVVESIATDLTKRGADDSWNEFWEEVMQVLPSGPQSLVGRHVLLGSDGLLYASGEDCEVYFAPGNSPDEDGEEIDRDDLCKVPVGLDARVAFLHPCIRVHQRGTQGRREITRVGRYLQNILVKSYRTENIIRHVMSVIPSLPPRIEGSHERLCLDLLRWALTLLEYKDAPNAWGLLGGLPLPCSDGWYPLRECLFGEGWELTHGPLLDTYLAHNPSDNCRKLRSRLLLPPSDPRWPVNGEKLTVWLKRLGVFDGLPLVEPEDPSWNSAVACETFDGVRRLKLPVKGPSFLSHGLWESYRASWTQAREPRRVYDYQLKIPLTIPGIERLDDLDEETRCALMFLLLSSVAQWEDGWQKARITRPRGDQDTFELDSPVIHWLREMPWLMAKQDGVPATFGRPRDYLLVPSNLLRHQVSTFRHLLPLPADAAKYVEETPGAREQLISLEMPTYDPEGMSADNRLLLRLADAWEQRLEMIRSKDVFIGQVRAAWAVFRPDSTQNRPERLIVNRGAYQIGVVTPDQNAPVYLPDGTDLVHHVLTQQKLPIIPIAHAAAVQLREFFQSAYGGAVKLASELVVQPMVGEKVWSEPPGEAAYLVNDEQFGSWLPQVLLAVFAFYGDRSHGTNTKSFQEAIIRLRSARLYRVEDLEMGLRKGVDDVIPNRVAGFWVKYASSLLIVENEAGSSLQKVTDALMALLDRSDQHIASALKLVLGKLSGTVPPTPEAVIEALGEESISESQFREIEEHWGGDLMWLLQKVEPIVALFDREKAMHLEDAVKSETDLLRILASLSSSEADAEALLRAIKKHAGDLELGQAVFHLLGSAAELDRWNEALVALGRAPVSNGDLQEQFVLSFRSAIAPLQAAFLHIARKNRGKITYRSLNDQLMVLPCPQDRALRYWDLPFQETMKIVAEGVLKTAASPDLVHVIVTADTVKALWQGLESLGIPKDDPAEIYRQNQDTWEKSFTRLRNLAIAWSDREKQTLPAWCERSIPYNTRLETDGYLDAWSLDECYSDCRGAVLNDCPVNFAAALNAARSLDELMTTLGLSEADVNSATDRIEQIRERAARNKRLISVCGHDFDSAADRLHHLPDHILKHSTSAGGLDLTHSVKLARVRERSGQGRSGNSPGASSGGAGGSLRRNHLKDQLVGLAGEIHVFRMLQKTYGQDVVTAASWRSSNSTYMFPGNKGDDGLGCDFEITIKGVLYHVEVKASDGDWNRFELGSSEISLATRLASSKKKRFIIIHVINALSSSPEFRVLPNPYSANQKSFYAFKDGGLRVEYDSVKSAVP